jgi:hypothetical protein
LELLFQILVSNKLKPNLNFDDSDTSVQK